MSLHVIFVCRGNICRSPMAERIAQRFFADAGLDVEVTSAGITDEEHANPMDPRARAVLNRRGYDVRPHTAHQISAEEIRRADLVVAAEPYQVQTMVRMAPSTRNIVLLRDYDPSVTPGTPLDDPWFGDASGFETIADQIEAAMPGLVAAIRKLPRHRDRAHTFRILHQVSPTPGTRFCTRSMPDPHQKHALSASRTCSVRRPLTKNDSPALCG